MLRRWKCTCAYDGASFAGWQSQAGGGAVQDIIEARLAKIVGAAARIHGSGRTDAGVHARAQVFHFDADWRHGPAKLLAAFRPGLPAAIQIKSARPAPAGFHARFSATGKIYTYDIQLGDADPFTRPYCWMVFHPLDLAVMEATAACLRGRHDFRAFSSGHGDRTEDTVRHVRRLELVRRGRRLRVTVEADGFLYRMVRNLVGALVAAGQGRLTREQVERMLATPARAPRVEAAPPQGLFLDRVFY
jgi:tRNA pseudouridine38-40 synthase